ncbi:MAG: hypothetical protein LUC32_08785 [Clostridiales bacterium]|nr:hypothetical protein [Clostridiales bacterium]
MKYTVLSPWASAASQNPLGLSPRLDTLEGKTIGLYAHFKGHAVRILDEVARELEMLYPNIRFSHYQYLKEITEIIDDEEYAPQAAQWASEVDAVISAYGDAGSCSMFLAKNAAFFERQGKPTVNLTCSSFHNSSKRGAASQGVPGLRLVEMTFGDLSGERVIDDALMDRVVRPEVKRVAAQIVDALTLPLTQEEKCPAKSTDYSNYTYTGTISEINDHFYKMGWTTGLPVVPPTREAVDEMLTGTDLTPDTVVGIIPPMNGIATVEKIAINAVMAGCLPTYLPVIIAAVRGMLQPQIQLCGWTCSNANWMPFTFVNGKVARDIHLHSGRAILSPYYKPNTAIPRALSYITMNIGGVRQGMEDMSAMGTVGRGGVCIAENEEASPWEPLQTRYGFSEKDSTVTMFWPADVQTLGGGLGGAFTPEGFLKEMCHIRAFGWWTGGVFILSPEIANMFADAGWTKQRILNYVVEYNRIPADEWNLRWLVQSNHEPRIAGGMDIETPLDGSYSARRFWNDDHMFIVVAGAQWGVAVTGGGDHGGPACVKIDLPENWDSLVEKYSDIVPHYLDY